MTNKDILGTDEYISDLCDALDRLNAPNPLNPAGISDLVYSRIMTGLHDETWTRDFIFGEPRDYYENYLDNEFERGHK